VAAVALSVSLLIVVSSLFTGFIEAVQNGAVDMVGDVLLAAPAAIERYPDLIERLEETDLVIAATGSLSAQGLLHAGRGNVHGVTVWGIEPDRRARVTNLKTTLVRQAAVPEAPSFEVPGAAAETGGFVGIGVVADPDETTDEYDRDAILADMLGRRVFVTTGTIVEAEDADGTPRRKLIPFYIADIVCTGVYEFDEGFVYVPIKVLQEALYPRRNGDLATTISIKLRGGADPEQAVTQIRGLWRVFAAEELGWDAYRIAVTEVITARQMQAQYVVELRKQMGVLLLIFGVISFSVVVLVFCIFYMIVKLKQKDVAILKSCGTGSLSVACIFLGFGTVVGLAGAGIGAVLGYVITRNINTVEEWIRIVLGLKLWQSSVYMFSRIPNEVDWASALPIVALAVAAASLGALLPAVLAARTRPVEILRYE
jgi:ABC-type lipoprotein release transport system permease subunit